MSDVKKDNNWNNHAVIIDCSMSKKRKQREVELHCAVTAKNLEREERYGADANQAPPAGILETETNKFGRVTSIVPRVELQRVLAVKLKKNRPTVIVALKPPVLGGTIVNIKNYTKHYTDPDHVVVEHQKVIGLMKQWKLTVLGIVREMEEEWDYSWLAFKSQHDWAKNSLERMIQGLSKFKMISVGVLNQQAAIKLIDGIDDEEMADLAINLASCKSCEIAILRHDELQNCSIVTIFDGNNNHKVAYGKKEIEDLNKKEGETKKNTCYANF
jgi:hypothetical protein